MLKFIGFDATEDHRVKGGGGTYATKGINICPRPELPNYQDRYSIEYPLRHFGMDRAACIAEIQSVGLPVPPKSACFFCPAMKEVEILQLKSREPELYALALEMERLYRGGRHFRGDDTWTVRATHKTTKEKLEVAVQAHSPAQARAQFRAQVQDSRPYQWDCKPSRAVPGLGRSFKWEDIA